LSDVMPGFAQSTEHPTSAGKLDRIVERSSPQPRTISLSADGRKVSRAVMVTRTAHTIRRSPDRKRAQQHRGYDQFCQNVVAQVCFPLRPQPVLDQPAAQDYRSRTTVVRFVISEPTCQCQLVTSWFSILGR